MLPILEGASASTDIGKKVVSRLFGPATLFWGGGIVAAISFYGWVYFYNYFTSLDRYQIVGLGLAGFILLMSSDVVMEWLTLPLLRVMEGYGWPVQLRSRIGLRWRKKLAEKKERLQQLSQLDFTRLPLVERLARREEQLQLDTELARYPVNWNNLMPTPIGNRLRAAQEHSYTRYGLEAITVWPHLWLVLPEKTQQELSVARQQLDRATQLLGWAVLFLLWTYFAWWAAAIAILMVPIAYYRILYSAGIYGDLIRAAFDLHRFDLYKQMNWPLPENSHMEKGEGKRLTRYIRRGYLDPAVSFGHVQSLQLAPNHHAQKSATPTNGTVRQLNGLVESRPPERFQLVDPMPYVVGPPITPESGSPFVGRQALMNWIEDSVQEVQKPILVLYGQRRIGKTSLLLQVARGAGGKRLREGGEGSKRVVYPVYIDLQGLTDLGTDLFLFEMADTIATAVRGRDVESPLKATKVRPFSISFHPTPLILARLTTIEADDLIQKPAISRGIRFSTEEIISIKQLAGSLPFFLQAAAETWFKAKQQQVPSSQIKAQVKQKFASAMARHFYWYWPHFTEYERILLTHIATQTPTEWSTYRQPSGELVINDLLKYGLITQEGESYHIAGEVFAEWIRDRTVMPSHPDTAL